jgi:hypothetical protein
VCPHSRTTLYIRPPPNGHCNKIKQQSFNSCSLPRQISRSRDLSPAKSWAAAMSPVQTIVGSTLIFAVPILFKVTEPSSISYRTPPACAKRAAYPDPPPVVPVPDTGVAQAAYKRLYCPGPLRPEMFSGIGALPEPATESHVVNWGTLVAPCRLKAQRKRVTRVGSPCSPVFPNIMSCLKSPITAKPRVTH